MEGHVLEYFLLFAALMYWVIRHRIAKGCLTPRWIADARNTRAPLDRRLKMKPSWNPTIFTHLLKGERHA
jgi:hypothetical protein